MKKLIIAFGVLAMLMISCDSKSDKDKGESDKDKKASKPFELNDKDLKDPCDIVDAWINIKEYEIALYKNNEKHPVADWNKGDRNNLVTLKKEIEIIINIEKIKINEYGNYEEWLKAMEECKQFDAVEGLEKTLNDLKKNAKILENNKKKEDKGGYY